MKQSVFWRAGTPCNQEQEQILELVRIGLKSSGLTPLQPKFSGKAPLLNVRETLDQCAGIVVVAYPRYLIEKGTERPGCKAESTLENAHLGTTWTHIESAIAYDRGLPIMILRDKLVKAEGFLEQTYDRKVQTIDFDTDFLTTEKFGILMEEFSNQIDDFKRGKYKRFSINRQPNENN